MTMVRHVGVEATRLLREKRGIGRYVRNMLILMPQLRPDIRFTLYVRRAADIAPVRAQLVDLSSGLVDVCRIEPVSLLPRSLADVVWYPWNWLRPSAKRAAMVATVHDFAPMLQFDHRWWKVVKRFKQRRRYASTVARADLIMTISSFTAREAERLLAVDPAKIRVTLLAADDLTAALPARVAGVAGDHPDAFDHSETLDRLGIHGPFFLTVGAHDARKNLATLYRAMAHLHEGGVRVPLVQCGPNVVLTADGTIAPWIRAAGYVSDAELATLYRRATALVFPSRYEGFGLPVAEAMMAGGCVICADASSLPEVAGDAALLFPWDDAAALAKQMTRLLEDSVLRAELVRRGRPQAAKFTWRKCALETLAAFDEAVALHAHRQAL